MNRVIKFLMISDILVLTSFGLIDPILAIFFKEDLVGGSILMAGLAGTIFLLVKSSIQLPFSKYVDSHTYPSLIKWLILGTFLISTVPFIYIFSKSIYGIFLAQVIFGIGSGFAYPTWLGLWSTHLDKNKESFEWSLYSTLAGLGTALTAVVGAALAQWVGFNFTFILVGIVSFVGCLMLFELDRREKKSGFDLGRNYQKRSKLVGRI
ncbi:MAG: MFS transporter [Nanoarchaeota archaeon]|nr:MFS transporter [Nanoarchaeota archaeon]MBU1643708.1 MFS transporter [Nanoarchaeota archaeon]MBU1977274.1 MFS transporter [Nanoarchaeota archaeon]